MEITLYNDMMDRLRKMTFRQEAKVHPYDEKNGWPEHTDYQMIFQKDMAFELGGEGKKSANLTCVTTDPDSFQGNQVLVVGPELREISSAVSYARICEVLVSREDDKDLEQTGDTEKIYKLLQDMDFVKYHVFPRGFMLRSSGQSGREQVRVGKSALQEGLSFEKIGNVFLSHYLKHERVRAVRVIFLTDPRVDYSLLQKEAKLAADIRNSLSMLQKGIPTECGSCTIRDICSEVDGLRELHFGKTTRPRERNPLS